MSVSATIIRIVDDTEEDLRHGLIICGTASALGNMRRRNEELWLLAGEIDGLEERARLLSPEMMPEDFPYPKPRPGRFRAALLHWRNYRRRLPFVTALQETWRMR